MSRSPNLRYGGPRRESSAFWTQWLWLGLCALWFVGLCIGPDPRPLSAPDWAVEFVGLFGLGERAAPAAATLLLRVGGLALLGALLMFAMGARRLSWRSAVAVLAAPVLAVAALWINYGYFPIAIQIQIAAISAALGALLGLALRRNRAAGGIVVSVTAILVVWGTATGIDDDLSDAAGATGRYLLAVADDIPAGDAGFARLIELAFLFAEDNARDVDPVIANQAAILALGVILGDERVAEVARRQVDMKRMPEIEALRDRITVQGRPDWSRHFWVSATLTLLSDSDRSMTVGLTKEFMDAIPGGSGFSFSDLAADAAGNLFAMAATRDPESARATQRRIRNGVRIDDYLPKLLDLPEGLSREQLQLEYGGLGGAGTQELATEILRRLSGCAGLQ